MKSNSLRNKKKESEIDEAKHVLILDFGGGIYDVSIVEMDEFCVETIASSGNQMLGGADFDNKLIEFCLNNFSKKIKIDIEKIKNNYKSMQRLKIACEKTKKILSTKMEDIIYIEDFYEQEPLSIPITRERFEELCKDIFDKLLIPFNHAIEDAKKK